MKKPEQLTSIHILNFIKNKKQRLTSFHIDKLLQKKKTQITKLRQIYPYFTKDQSNQEVQTLLYNYERTFIVFKKLNNFTKSTFFLNLPSNLTSYCGFLHELQASKKQCAVKILKNKLLKQLFNQYTTTQYKLHFWKNILTFTRYLKGSPQLHTNKTKHIKKHLLLTKLKRLIQVPQETFQTRIPGTKTKKIFVTIKADPAKSKKKYILLLKKKLQSTLLYRLLKIFFKEAFKQSIIHYLSNRIKPLLTNLFNHTTNISLLKVQYHKIVKSLHHCLNAIPLNTYYLKINKSLNTTYHGFFPALKTITNTILTDLKIRLNTQKTYVLHVKSPVTQQLSKPTYTFLDPKTLKLMSLKSCKVGKLPTFNFISLSTWVLGRLSNYSFLKSQLPVRLKKKYYLPIIFNSIQQLNLTKIHKETKDIFEFFFFPKTYTVTEPVLESISHILLTYWRLDPVTICDYQRTEALTTLLNNLYELQETPEIPTSTATKTSEVKSQTTVQTTLKKRKKYQAKTAEISTKGGDIRKDNTTGTEKENHIELLQAYPRITQQDMKVKNLPSVND